jgi:Lhr-like helicase
MQRVLREEQRGVSFAVKMVRLENLAHNPAQVAALSGAVSWLSVS